MVGVIAATVLAQLEARRRGQDAALVSDLLLWVLVAGILGARIWHILTPSPSLTEQGITTLYYLTHPLDAIAIWKGGLGIPGAVIGGALALYLFSRKHHLEFPVWLDMLAPALALGQAIGRWGNFFNQELYGAPTNRKESHVEILSEVTFTGSGHPRVKARRYKNSFRISIDDKQNRNSSKVQERTGCLSKPVGKNSQYCLIGCRHRPDPCECSLALIG